MFEIEIEDRTWKEDLKALYIFLYYEKNVLKINISRNNYTSKTFRIQKDHHI